MSELCGCRVFVIGGVSGIGVVCVCVFVVVGFYVMVVDIDCGVVEDLVFEIGGVVWYVDFVDSVVFVGVSLDVDIFVNNVGVQYVSLIEDFVLECFLFILWFMFEVLFLLICVVFFGMYECGFGWIINVFSVYGLWVFLYKLVYVVVKYGFEGLFKVMVLEGGFCGVMSNCIDLGYVCIVLVEKQIVDQVWVYGIFESEVFENVFFMEVLIK